MGEYLFGKGKQKSYRYFCIVCGAKLTSRTGRRYYDKWGKYQGMYCRKRHIYFTSRFHKKLEVLKNAT